MILFLENGEQIRGDLIRSAILRSDMSPLPLTLEADIVIFDDMMETMLSEQHTVKVNEDEFIIVKSEPVKRRISHDERDMSAVRITALLSCCAAIVTPCKHAIIKENASLSAIYRAAGAKLKGIASDFPVPRFYCLAGETPSFHIARILQEEGGCVFWKKDRLTFSRINDLYKQKPVLSLPVNESDNVKSDYLKQHETASFFSTNESGSFVSAQTKRNTATPIRFSPFKNEQRLNHMSTCLTHGKITKMNIAVKIGAGDLIDFVGGEPMLVITAAHVYESAIDSSGASQYTRLWLGRLGK